MIVLAISTVIAVALHLWSKLAFNDGVANMTKPLLMPLLYSTMFAVAGRLGIAIEDPWVIVVVAVLYTLGDILLIPKDRPVFFMSGALSFIAGHMFFAAYFMLESFSLVFFLIGIAAASVPFASYMHKVLRKERDSAWAFGVYGGVIAVLFVGVVASFSPVYPLYSVVALIGVVFYGYSDSRIVYNIVKHRATSDFEIMWTYIAANLFLAASVLLLNA